jgi:retron-type reverse transcriptase
LLANLMLANLMLDVLDKELEARCHRFVRGACPRAGRRPDPWADDCNIYVQSRIYVQGGGAGYGERRLHQAKPNRGVGSGRRRWPGSRAGCGR